MTEASGEDAEGDERGKPGDGGTAGRRQAACPASFGIRDVEEVDVAEPHRIAASRLRRVLTGYHRAHLSRGRGRVPKVPDPRPRTRMFDSS